MPANEQVMDEVEASLTDEKVLANARALQHGESRARRVSTAILMAGRVLAPKDQRAWRRALNFLRQPAVGYEADYDYFLNPRVKPHRPRAAHLSDVGKKALARLSALKWDDPGPGPDPGPDPVPVPVDDHLAKWRMKSGHRSGKHRPRGLSITWASTSIQRYSQLLTIPDVLVGGSHAGGRTKDWDNIAGGPIEQDTKLYGDVSRHLKDGQTNFHGTNFGTMLEASAPTGTWLVHVSVTIPDSMSTVGNPSKDTWQQLSGAGRHEQYWYAFGYRLGAQILAAGKDPEVVALRPNHEMNQSNMYQVFPGTIHYYAMAMTRFCVMVRAGYRDATGGAYLRIILSPSRHDNIGPLDAFLFLDANGRQPYDAIDVSAHMAGREGTNAFANQTFDKQLDVCRRWIRGEIDGNGYAPDHVDPALSQKAFAIKHKIAMCYTEWSPRYDEEHLEGCHISAAFYQAMHEHFTACHDAGLLAFEAVFHSKTIDPSDLTPGWRDGVQKYTELWKADPSA